MNKLYVNSVTYCYGHCVDNRVTKFQATWTNMKNDRIRTETNDINIYKDVQKTLIIASI